MPKKRVLSEFLCRELLYDYVCDKLDKERRHAVEESLKENDDVQLDLKALKEGLKYTDVLRNTRLSEPYYDSLSRPQESWRDLGSKWSKLPSAAKWGIESFAIACLLGLFVMLIPKQYLPWNKVTTFTLTEIDRNSNVEVVDNSDTSITPTTVVTEATFGPPTTLKVAANAIATSVTTSSVTTTQVIAKQTTTTTTLLVSAQPVSLPAVGAIKTKGEIYRLFMNSDKVDKITPQLIDKIMSLGGEKAGEVQLGWRRRQGSYFHFSMPESNYDELVKYLQTFGQVRIVRESHSRVMPPGTIRLILWLETNTAEPAIENDRREEPAAQ